MVTLWQQFSPIAQQKAPSLPVAPGKPFLALLSFVCESAPCSIPENPEPLGSGTEFVLIFWFFRFLPSQPELATQRLWALTAVNGASSGAPTPHEEATVSLAFWQNKPLRVFLTVGLLLPILPAPIPRPGPNGRLGPTDPRWRQLSLWSLVTPGGPFPGKHKSPGGTLAVLLGSAR